MKLLPGDAAASNADEFMSAFKLDPLKAKIQSYKSVVKQSLDKVKSLDLSFAATSPFTDGVETLDRAKAHVNQFAGLLLLKNSKIRILVKGVELRKQLRGIINDMTNHGLLKYLALGVEDSFKEVVAECDSRHVLNKFCCVQLGGAHPGWARICYTVFTSVLNCKTNKTFRPDTLAPTNLSFIFLCTPAWNLR